MRSKRDILENLLISGGDFMMDNSTYNTENPDFVAVGDSSYEFLAENDDVFIASVDSDGIIRHVNEVLCSALGRNKQDLIGLHVYQVIPEYDSKGNFQWNRVENVVKSPKAPSLWEMELRNQKGEPLWIEWRTFVLKSPQTGKLYSIDIGTNISDRRCAEEKVDNAYYQHYRSEIFNNAVEKKLPFAAVCEQVATIHRTISAPLVCLVLNPYSSINGKKVIETSNADWKSRAIQSISAATPTYNQIMWHCRNGVAILVSLSPSQNFDDQITALTSKISDVLQNQDSNIKPMLGVSEVFLQPENITVPYKQALESSCFGVLICPNNSVCHWKNLGLLKLLLDVSLPLGKQFMEEKLGPLLKKPPPLRNDLLATLGELLTNASVSVAAQRLHVHPKTIAYRRGNLENIFNVDFEDPMTRTDFLVALRLYQIRNHPWQSE